MITFASVDAVPVLPPDLAGPRLAAGSAIGALLETPELRAWLERYQSSAAPFREFDATFWAGAGGWGLPLPPKPEPPPVRPGVLWWPTGASRFAVCHLLFDSVRMAALRDAVGPANDPATLRIWDGTGGGDISTEMRVVAERRLLSWADDEGAAGGEVPGTLGLTLVTLADVRYDWRLKPLSVTEPPATYDDLIDQIATALGETIGLDAAGPIDAAFGVPSDRWVGYARPAPVVLDAALNAVGRRLVRRLDGTLVAQTWGVAKTDAEAWRRDEPGKTAGGRVAGEVAGRTLPEAVRVSFVNAGDDATPHTSDQALVDLAIDGFGDAVGSSAQTATLYCDGVTFTGGNSAACAAAAEALATAWYGWRQSPQDVVYPGVVGYTITGQDEAVEWDHSLDATGEHPVRTRVYGGPVNWLPSGGPAADGGDKTFLVMLTAKCYYDGSGDRDPDGVTPAGNELNCAADVGCLTRSIKYSARKVVPTDHEDPDTGDHCPQGYTFADPPVRFSAQCKPLYHARDLDIPVYPEPSPWSAAPSAAADRSGAGTITWDSPVGIPAAATLTDATETHYLKLTDCCLGLAGNATVTNVEVVVTAKVDATGGVTVRDEEVKLVVGGSPVGTNKATNTALAATATDATYSFSPTDWGVPTLSVEQVNAADFGVAVRFRQMGGADRVVTVTAVTVSVAFTPAGVTIPRLAVVRVNRGPRGLYFFDVHPWVDLFRRTPSSDGDGVIAYHRYYDQNAGDWRDGFECRVIVAG